MLPPGRLWRHVTLNTHAGWLPGDPRGFRARDHKIHSGGDYHNPPPPGEHAGLFRYSQAVSAPTVAIAGRLRQRVGVALRNKLVALGHPPLTVSVSNKHAHLVVLLFENPVECRKILGKAKQKASHAVRDELPGQVWAEGADLTPVTTAAHLLEAIKYDRDHLDEGAFVWLSDTAGEILEGRIDLTTLM